MENNPFEVGGEIDIETLMSRIRETAKRRSGAAPVASSTKLERKSLQALQPQRLTQEIHSGALSTEVINQIPVKRRGTKGRIEFRVKKFLKWLVHWNTKGQADFNHSVMRSLGLIAQDLQTGQHNFAIVEDLLRDERERLSRLEQQASQDLADIRSRIEKESALVEQKLREREERTAQAIVEEVGKRTEVIAAQSSEFERIISRTLEQVWQNAAKLQEELDRNALETRRQAEQAARFLTMLEDIAKNSGPSQEEISKTTETLSARSSELERKLDHALDELRMRILRAERIARNASRDTDTARLVKTGDSLSDVQPNVRNQRANGKEKAGTGALTSIGEPFGHGFDYFLFEQQYRGPVSEIKRRQAAYVDLFHGKENVVDLGCGRGEFVELLSENGINVTGVDCSEDMVDFCRDRGLRVVKADIFDYLGSMPDGNFDGIFLSQVVEHLLPAQILKLLGLCADKLSAGGVIVAETVNTNCPAALSNFYLDPTHVRPVPAEMLRFMLEQASFHVQYLRFSSPLSGNDVSEVLDLASGFSQEVSVYQDYAVVAVKR